MTATGVSGAPVRGLFSLMYSPGGSTPPLNIGTYTVSAQFISTDPNYGNATGTGTITIVSPTPTQTVTPAGNLQFGRVSHQATLLANGLVLVSGGHSGGAALAQAELFNPNTSTWSATGANVIPRFDHTATLLTDGRVLVVGGVSAVGDCSANATAETYDLTKGTWSLTGRLPFPEGTGHIAIRLLDGRVLVAGGGDRCGTVFNTAAIFNPTTNTWAATGNMTVAREFHSAALLQDGRALVAGGVRGSPLAPIPSAEIYDPTTGTWTAVADMATPRQTSCNGYVQPYLAALSGGSILAAGGFSGPNCSPITPQRTVTDVTVTPGFVQFAALGRTQTLIITAQLSDGSSQAFTGPLQFTSADPAVASVDASGVITAVAAGTTTITATPSGFAPVSVTTAVQAAHLTSISVNPAAISFIGAGQVQSLTVNGQFSDSSQQALTTGLTFSSSNSAVAGIDQNGLITSGANGTATIAVSTPGAALVQVPVLVKSLVAIAPSPTSLTLIGAGQIRPLSIVGQYSDGSQQTLTTGLSFISSDPSVARVDLTGVVSSGNNGTATITIAAANVAAIQVPVTVKSLVSISSSPAAVNLVGRGQHQSLTITGQFSDGLQQKITTGLSFQSSNSPVASVDTAGMITSGDSGSATITVSVQNLSPVQVPVIVTAAAVLSVTKSHAADFTQGQQGATYTVSVSNAPTAGPTSGTVTVTESLPTRLAFVSMSGDGWQCAVTSCSRTDVLPSGGSYPPIVVTVNVASTATSPQSNTVTVSGGSSATTSATDPTVVIAKAPVLSVSKTHVGSFTVGQQGATYTVAVSNAADAGPTTGTVTVTDTVPSGLTLVSMAGGGWQCVTASCTRNDALVPGSNYPPITVNVNVNANAASPLVNTVQVSGGGSAEAIASDSTTLVSTAPACTTASANLVAWWPGNGNTNDLFGEHNPSAVNSVNFVSGKVGQGFSFGLGGYIDIPASASLANQRLTMEGWVRPDGQGPNNDFQGSWIVGQDKNNTDGVGLFWRATDNRFVLLFGSQGSELLVSQNSFPPQQFYHVAGTYDGATVTLFVNGNVEGQVAWTGTIPYSSIPWTIGSSPTNIRNQGYPRTWNGVIDEVSLYSRALSQTEIQSIFTAGSSGKCPQVQGLAITEAHAVPFSVLNLAGVTGGQPLSSETNAQPFSILNIAGGAPNQPLSKEVNAVPFSVLNVANMTGGQPQPVEVDGSSFSVLNTDVSAIGGSGGQPIPFEVDARVVVMSNFAGGFGVPGLRACYDGSIGTLPQSQGWTYSGDGTNPTPTIVNGSVLHENTTAGAQYWSRSDSTADAAHVVIEARLRVNSSNYVPNIGTGTREGYYFQVRGNSTGFSHTVGLANTGFNIDSTSVPNQPLTPFAIADGAFHTYRFEVVNGIATLSIDGSTVGSAVQTPLTGSGVTIFVGGAAGASRSDTDLMYVCYSAIPK